MKNVGPYLVEARNFEDHSSVIRVRCSIPNIQVDDLVIAKRDLNSDKVMLLKVSQVFYGDMSRAKGHVLYVVDKKRIENRERVITKVKKKMTLKRRATSEIEVYKVLPLNEESLLHALDTCRPLQGVSS